MLNETTLLENEIHPKIWGSETWQLLPRKSSTIDRPNFQILPKIINAKTCLSIQVHPTEKACQTIGGKSKSELWAILSSGTIYAGLKPRTKRQDIVSALESKTLEHLLIKHTVNPGDIFYIPAGLVHAIGDNTLIYEVQQNSDTTFRLYDWNRIDANGKSRELHIEQALESINYDLPIPKSENKINNRYFNFRMLEINGYLDISNITSNTALIIFNISSKQIVINGNIMLNKHSSAFIPQHSKCVLNGTSQIYVTECKC